MNGIDLRMMKQNPLPLQMNILWVLPELLLQCTPDSVLHLSCCRPRKGNHQKLVYIDRMIRICDPANNVLDQNRCFSGTRRCGSENICISLTNYQFLVRRPLNRHLTIPPSPTFRLPPEYPPVSASAVSGTQSPESDGQNRRCPDTDRRYRHSGPSPPAHTDPP